MRRIDSAPGDGQAPVGAGEFHSPAVRVFRRFPVTILTALPYALLILPQAIVHGNSALSFIISVMSLALAATLITEFLLQTKSNGSKTAYLKNDYAPQIYTVARAVVLIGGGSSLLAASFGVGSVFAQVHGSSGVPGGVTALSSFSQWGFIGVGLLVASYLYGFCSRRQVLKWIAVLTVIQVAEASFTAILAPTMGFLIFLVIVLLYFGILRVRQCIVLALIVVIAWPAVFMLRNDVRRTGGIEVSASVDAFDRLRYDLQVGAAEGLGSGVDVGQPGPIELLRYGLLPRFLDPGRPALDTGSDINVFMGGTPTSSFSFLPVTTLYFLEGPGYVVVIYSGLAMLIRLVMKGGTIVSPMRIMVFSMLISGPLGWFNTYPSSLVGFLQGLVSLIPIGLFVWVLRRRTVGTTKIQRRLQL